MTFIVSFNGQFSPYPLPDLSHFDRVSHIYRSKRSNAIREKGELAERAREDSKKDKFKKEVNSYENLEQSFQKSKIPHHARDIMSKKVKYLYDGDLVSDAVFMMKKYELRHFPILNESKILIGMISDRDLIGKKNNQKVTSFMNREVLTCLDTTRIQEMAKIMLHEKISALPIINHKYEMIGIVTLVDILDFVTRIISINSLI